MKILLVSGHGAGDCGAVGNGYKEADLTREMTSLIKPRLSKYADVTLFDQSKNACSMLRKGGSINFKPYGYVFEVHFNAFNGAAHGTEIFVTKSEKGTSVEQAIVDNVASLGFTNRGVKRENWTVIYAAKKQGVSSALFETCFIDNAADMKLYQSKKNAIADAIVNGIVKGFGLTANDKNEIEKAKEIIKKKAGLEDKTIQYLANYQYGEDLLKKLANAMK